MTNVQTYFERQKLSGILYIKNIQNNTALPILQQMSFLNQKYDSEILLELDNNVLSFEIYSDVLFIKTDNYIIIEKMVYENGGFVTPKTDNNIIQYNTHSFNKPSNFVKKDFSYYFVLLDTLEITPLSSTDITLYPKIYKFDISNYELEQLWPISNADITSTFQINNGIQYIEASSVNLTHSENNDVFGLSYIINDQNKLPSMVHHIIDIKSNIDFIKSTIYTPHDESYSLITSYNSNLNSVGYVPLSSTAPQFDAATNELIF